MGFSLGPPISNRNVVRSSFRRADEAVQVGKARKALCCLQRDSSLLETNSSIAAKFRRRRNRSEPSSKIRGRRGGRASRSVQNWSGAGASAQGHPWSSPPVVFQHSEAHALPPPGFRGGGGEGYTRQGTHLRVGAGHFRAL